MAKKYPQFKKELTYEEVLRKFSNLRKYYNKETKKQLMFDPSERKRPKWEHSEKLSFLDEYLFMESNFNLDEPTGISFDETIQDRTDVLSSSTQTLNRTKSKPTETDAGSAIAKAAAALEEIASTMTDNLLRNGENGVPSSSFKQKKRIHVETEHHIMAKAAEALERIANAPRKTPEELFFSDVVFDQCALPNVYCALPPAEKICDIRRMSVVFHQCESTSAVAAQILREMSSSIRHTCARFLRYLKNCAFLLGNSTSTNYGIFFVHFNHIPIHKATD
ncbi:hypothetical protein JTE90_002373 [Oedothorax gibbosus]|uniref:MADF domain-containing protein n=1 Tax=Oedothorax gibbosus TaxID=931172 RepID=A0AAV6VDN4_9ARAC|nr:hypothetical protein JTE90_002373 [Oedothorax gibbosus]